MLYLKLNISQLKNITEIYVPIKRMIVKLGLKKLKTSNKKCALYISIENDWK